jgi:xylan 1,4-beta-xylosidase
VKKLLVCLLAMMLGGCYDALGPAEKMYHNPIVQGDWSDPGVIRVGEDYYSCRSSFGWQPGIPIIHSRDLLHWEYVGHAFQSHPKLNAGDTRTGIWGLDLGFNPNTKQFQIYAPTRDGEVYVFSADRPEGPYEMKSLGQNLGIDPGVFADDDGRIYLVTNKAVIQQLSPDGRSIQRQVVAVNKSKYRFFEGPDIFKHGGYYYLLFSDGGTLPHEPSTISVLRAKQLEGPWEPDPGNPVMFSTDNGARFEGPAHGTLVETQNGEWFLTYHAHEPAYYSLGRQMLMERIEWTNDGWWRPVGGKVPTTEGIAPSLKRVPLALAQSDEFSDSKLGLQWFFTCAPDFSGKTWSLSEKPGSLVIHAPPGDLGSLSALPAIFQQEVFGKAVSFQARVTSDAGSAGLHLYHDPLMNLWLASTLREGKRRIEVGKYTLGVRTSLWSAENALGSVVNLKIDVREETARFFYGNGTTWKPIGGEVYFGASGHHLRDGKRGDPDLGWVGRYKEAGATAEQINGLPGNQRQSNRGGNIWTGTTFGLFAVQDGSAPGDATFDHFRVDRDPHE